MSGYCLKCGIPQELEYYEDDLCESCAFQEEQDDIAHPGWLEIGENAPAPAKEEGR